MDKTLETAIVLGSGGHTSEMIKLLKELKFACYKPRHYIIAETDKMSIQKTHELENDSKEYKIHCIKRSRHVGQSYFTSVFTTLMAIFFSISLIYKIKPKILLVNGPGTCIPLCFVAYIFSKLYIMPKCEIIFIESICRVQSLSLSGKILYHLKIADLMFVQWPELKEMYKNVIYLGRLV